MFQQFQSVEVAMLTEKPKRSTSLFENEMPSLTHYDCSNEVSEFAFSGEGQKDNFNGVSYEGGCGPWYDHYLREKKLCSKAKG